jgi:hypothetical protein
MRKVLTALATGVLTIALSAPAAHAASSMQPAGRCHRGIVGSILDWLL